MFVILLTATIDPGNMPFVKRLNPIQRENDYIDCIRFWSNFNYRIVFCENSGWDLARFKKEIEPFSDKVEIIQNNSNKNSIKFGKGHGEMEILYEAFRNSQYIDESNYVIKVTGRYKVKNFKKIMKIILRNDNMKDIYAVLNNNLTWADSRFFIAKKSFYQRSIFTYRNKINDYKKIYFENVLAKSILYAVAVYNMSYDRMPLLPFFQGVYGTENKPYSNNYIKYFLKNIKYNLNF